MNARVSASPAAEQQTDAATDATGHGPGVARGSPAAAALFLQRTAGNAAVAQLIGRTGRAAILRQPPSGAPTDAPPAPADAGAPPGGDKVTLGKFEIYLDRASQRRHAEALAADKGLAEPRRYLEEANLELARQTPDAGVPDNQSDLDKARPALATFKEVVGEFERDAEAFLTTFEEAARKVTLDLLADSEARAKAEGIKFGLTSEQIERRIKTGDGFETRVRTKYHMDKESPEAATVAAGAKKLLERRAEIAPLKKHRDDLLASWARSLGPAGGGPMPPKPAELAPLEAEITEKERAYDVFANELSARHPSLANAARNKDDTQALQTLAAGPSDEAAQLIGEQVAESLKNIETVRKELKPGGGANVYKLPKVLALTRARLNAEENWKGKAIEEKIQKAQADEAVIAIALGVLNLALLALAPATGGASLVVAAGISSAAAAQHAKEYMLESAMAGSDVDKARALSQDEPSLFWLAADIVFAMVDIGQAAGAAAKLIGAFGRLAPLAHEMKAAETAAEVDKALQALEKEAAAVGGEKLAQRVAESAKGDSKIAGMLKDVEAVEGAGRAAEGELKAAGEATSKSGHVHVTSRGKIFSCSSPCTEIRAKYGETLARNEKLLKDVETLENEAKTLGEKATKQQLDGIAAKVAALDDVIEHAARLERAEKILSWLKTVEDEFPILKSLPLDAEQMARVIEKTNVSHIKGQLLEEFLGSRVKNMIAAGGADAATIAGARAAEKLEYIPGHLIRADGRQFTDGMVVIRRGEQLEVVAILESKAGRASSRGLAAEYTSLKDLTEEEAKVIRREGIQHLRDTNPRNVPGLENMPSAKIEELYKADVDAAVKALPKTEPGQAVLDIERLGNGGITIDGSPVKVTGGRGSTKVVGAVPSDVSAEGLKNAVSPGKADVKFEALSMDIDQKKLTSLAEQIAERSKAPTL